jgi:hypothetical protein
VYRKRAAIRELDECDDKRDALTIASGRNDGSVRRIGLFAAVRIGEHIADVLLTHAPLRMLLCDVTEVVLLPNGAAWLHHPVYVITYIQCVNTAAAGRQ